MDEVFKIYLVGETHDESNKDWEDEAKSLASQKKIVLFLEGYGFDEKPIEENTYIYGVENKLVSQFGDILLAYRKARNILPSIAELRREGMEGLIPAFINHSTTKSILNYFANAIYHLCIEAFENENKVLLDCINKSKEICCKDLSTKNVLNYFINELYPKHKDYYDGSYYDEKQNPPKEVIDFFLKNKKIWDLFFEHVCVALLAEINKLPFLKDLCSELLNEKALKSFFDPLLDKNTYAEDVCQHVRNPIFVANILKIFEQIKKDNKKINIYFIVGNDHVSHLELLLQKALPGITIYSHEMNSNPPVFLQHQKTFGL